ncbi:DUF3761 domain-containing protein [Actinocrispum wychmicini]|uniref:DUF3761 domain-containing protein n=1 Tax=Actinocrispum wychmicini TaxID=1213861 RepID=UPI001FB6052D|nr:DUF3761 domain-containing protein [Actinocrispum wychmicini]
MSSSIPASSSSEAPPSTSLPVVTPSSSTVVAAPPAPPTQPPPPPATTHVAKPAPSTPHQTECTADQYRNVDGVCVNRPVAAPGAPAGATAQCKDGTYSFSQHHSGTCSGHGGVARWL